MPKPRRNEPRKDFMERCVPQLIDEGRNPDQAVAICSSMFNRTKASEELEPCMEISIEFEALFDGSSFIQIISKESIYPDMTLGDLFAKLNLDPSKRYEFEVSAEEC